VNSINITIFLNLLIVQ